MTHVSIVKARKNHLYLSLTMSLMMVSPKEKNVETLLRKNGVSQDQVVPNGKCSVPLPWTTSYGTFETRHRSFEKYVIERWIFLKENSNAYTWKHRFLESKFLIEKDIEDFENRLMTRSELAEWLLIKALQKIKSDENMKHIFEVVFKDGRGKGNVFHTESVSDIEALHVKLSSHQGDIEKTLKRADAITIKDHLVQDQIIELTENEKLIKDEKRFPDGKTSLVSAVLNIIIRKLKVGSYQSFIKSLETISNQKRRQPIIQWIQILKNEPLADACHLERKIPQVTTLDSICHERNIEGNRDFCLTIDARNSKGEEAKEAYRTITENRATTNTILSMNLGVELTQIHQGSLVIHFRMMERNMQDYLKYCLRLGKVSTVVQMLFSEIAIQDISQSEKLLLKVKIEVNEDSCLYEPLPEQPSTINKFVAENRSFITEEMDTDFMEEKLKANEKTIHFKPEIGRREKANQILDFIIEHKLAECIVRDIKTNEENRFEYLLRRLRTYEQVHETDASCLRKNILLQFSEIVKDIDIDDIRDILLERNAIAEDTLNAIDNRFINRRDFGMATLLLKILKSGDAVRAFVDALFIMRSPLAEKMINYGSEMFVVEKDSRVALCEKSTEENVLFEGSFNVVIEKNGRALPNNIEDSTPHNVESVGNGIASSVDTNNIKNEKDGDRFHESDDGDPSAISLQSCSSVESCNPGNVESPSRPMKIRAPISQQREGINNQCLQYDSTDSLDGNINERCVSSVESSTADSIVSPYLPIKNQCPPDDSTDSTERNINERCVSSVESSTADSILSPYLPIKNSFPSYDSVEFMERNINERGVSSVESGNAESMVSSCRLIKTEHDYKKSMQFNFRIVKRNIDILSVLEKASHANIITGEPGLWINSKRSQNADLIVTKILQTIELKDITKIQEILSNPIASKIQQCCSKNYEGQEITNSKLQRSSKVLMTYLHANDIEHLKDLFIEKSIIDINDNEDIIAQPGFIMACNPEFVEYFVNKCIIGKVALGSFQCLIEFLQDTTNKRLSNILPLLEAELNDNMDNAHSRPHVCNTLTVEQINSNSTVKEIERNHFEISLTFRQKNQQTDEVCKRLVSIVKTKNGVIAPAFEGIITKGVQKESVVIHLRSLHKYTLTRIINSISNDQFSKVLESLFTDDKIVQILTPANYTIEMDVRVCEDELNTNESPVFRSRYIKIITENRFFLEEEIDTLLVCEEFKNAGIFMETDIDEKDRDYRAEHVVDIAITDERSANIFLSTVQKMQHVAERLVAYDGVYKTDPNIVRTHVLERFSNISETVDLADLRVVFVERRIFEDKQLENIEKEFGHDRRDVMAVFLTEVIQKGNDALLALVDALFILGLNDLGKSLISDVTHVFSSEEPDNSIIKKGNTVLDDVPVVSATYVLKIEKGTVKRRQEAVSVDTQIPFKTIKRSQSWSTRLTHANQLYDRSTDNMNYYTPSTTVLSSQDQSWPFQIMNPNPNEMLDSMHYAQYPDTFENDSFHHSFPGNVSTATPQGYLGSSIRAFANLLPAEDQGRKNTMVIEMNNPIQPRFFPFMDKSNELLSDQMSGLQECETVSQGSTGSFSTARKTSTSTVHSSDNESQYKYNMNESDGIVLDHNSDVLRNDRETRSPESIIWIDSTASDSLSKHMSSDDDSDDSGEMIYETTDKPCPLLKRDGLLSSRNQNPHVLHNDRFNLSSPVSVISVDSRSRSPSYIYISSDDDSNPAFPGPCQKKQQTHVK